MKKAFVACFVLLAACTAAMAQETEPGSLFAGIEAVELSAEEMAAVEGGREAYDAVDTARSAPRTTKPIPGAVPSSGTGPRKPIVTAGGTTSGEHFGTDYPAPAGTAVRSAKDGKVISVGTSRTLGGKITIANIDGTKSSYFHVEIGVAEGARVRSGQVIGSVGIHGEARSGGTMSTGDHLHYEERSVSGEVVKTRVVEKY